MLITIKIFTRAHCISPMQIRYRWSSWTDRIPTWQSAI